MNATAHRAERQAPAFAIDVVEKGTRARRAHIDCVIDRNIAFSTAHLESYCLAQWEPVIFDALVLAAAVEYCDHVARRPALGWRRDIELCLPCHEPERWNASAVQNALRDALEFLTGDRWNLTFKPRRARVADPHQIHFDIPNGPSAVIPFSEGLDSCAVAGLMHNEIGDRLIRVRLGTKPFDAASVPGDVTKRPFTSIPYRVKRGERRFLESSGRSRGFKFALVSGLAAYLIKAERVIVPESGQGALGPALVPVGQAHPDFRNHPLFTDRMEKLVLAVFGHRVRYEFPQLWSTKGETLARFAAECGDGAAWRTTKSCWQQNRYASVNHRKRQCGICAACMLRRLSVHAAGLDESPDTYIWEDLRAPSFAAGAASGFKGVTRVSMQHYAIAGTLHLDHLAALIAAPGGTSRIALAAAQLGGSRGIPERDTRDNLENLLLRHRNEWSAYTTSLGAQSFIKQWIPPS